MRLPWPFQRFQRAPAPGAAAPAPAAAPAGSESRARDEWRQLPPITETVGPAPLIAPTAPFAADLSAGHPMPPVLAPLSHARGLDAPSGIVLGITRPVQRAPGSAAPHPLQRRAAGKRQGPIAVEASSMEPAQAEPASPAPVDSADTAVSSPAAPMISPRRLAVAKGQPRSAPIQRARLTAADPATVALSRVAGVVGQPKPAGQSTMTSLAALSALPSATAPQPIARDAQTSLPLSGPVSRKPAGGLQAPPVTPTTGPGRLTLGQSRRLGLGAPIASAPATALPAIAAERAAPLPLSAPTSAQRKPQTDPTAAAPMATPTPVTVSPHDAARPLPGARPTPVTVPVVARPLAQSGPRSAVAHSAPPVSAQPLRARVQRAPLMGSRPSTARDETREYAPGPASASPVRVHRGTGASEMAESLDAKAFTHQGEIYLPASHGPIGSPGARSLLAHELTHVAQQRAFGSRLPQEHTSHGQELESHAAAAERHPDMPLAQPPHRSTESSPTDAADLGAAQRSPVGTSRPNNDIVDSITINPVSNVQRASSDRSRKSARKTSDATDGKKSEIELEELAGQLYTRISRRLRQELRVDRERAGLMVDLP